MNHTSFKFLVVDDQELMLEITTSIVSEFGHSSIIAQSGIQALTFLHDGLRPDAIISDYNMPGINGLEFLKKVWSLPGKKNVPAIIVSSDKNPELIKRASQEGVLAWVDKLYVREGVANLIQGMFLNMYNMQLQSNGVYQFEHEIIPV